MSTEHTDPLSDQAFWEWDQKRNEGFNSPLEAWQECARRALSIPYREEWMEQVSISTRLHEENKRLRKLLCRAIPYIAYDDDDECLIPNCQTCEFIKEAKAELGAALEGKDH